MPPQTQTQTPTQTLTRTQAKARSLPRVNLLPPEIVEQRRFRRVQAGLAGALVAALALVGGLYVLATADRARQAEQLRAVQAETAVLQARQAEYAEVPQVFARVAAAEAQLTQAMGQEVRWSFFLDDLSRSVPDDLWMTKMIMLQTVDAAEPSVPSVNPASLPGVGTVTFEGTAFEHVDVSAWLDMLARQSGYADPFVTKSEEDIIGDDEVVNFVTSVTVTAEALEGRYPQRAVR
jgi:Tfp pilus assembly protein PilN